MGWRAGDFAVPIAVILLHQLRRKRTRLRALGTERRVRLDGCGEHHRVLAHPTPTQTAAEAGFAIDPNIGLRYFVF